MTLAAPDRTKSRTPNPALSQHATVALIGNPNAGKTSLFNRLTGLRARTANFAGTTVEHRRAATLLGQRRIELIDLPGLYSLDAATPEERVAHSTLIGEATGQTPPDVVVLVVDATNLERNLFLTGQVLELQRPVVVALNMMDEARRGKIDIDSDELSRQLGCKVVPLSARTGEGLDELKSEITALLDAQSLPRVDATLHSCDTCGTCPYAARFHWAEGVTKQSVTSPQPLPSRHTENIDRLLTHRVFGLLSVGVVLTAIFLLIFWIAQYPMEMIDGIFAWAGETVAGRLPDNILGSLVVDGIIPGVGGMLIFLPQIVILFFLLALLEDSGYMARAAFVMDKLMHKVGLPGKAFVPMLSGHACAIPAIMSTRVIEDHRDRLATILVVPLMSCSARVPVYAMVAALLFPRQPLYASLTFVGAYGLGIVAALVMGFLFRRTLLPGRTSPLVIELPNYRLPSLRDALLLTLDRAWVFVRRAGTVILGISIVLWALATFPQMDETNPPATVTAQLSELEATGAAADEAREQILSRAALEHSALGRLGHTIEPVFRPLGFNWEIAVGVLASFAAREVVVSTLAVVYGVGEEGAEGDSLYGALRSSVWPDGTPVFGFATCMSLLVFFVLAMQCLPTNAVTRRETGGWRWPIFQIVYMTALAYSAAWLTFVIASSLT